MMPFRRQAWTCVLFVAAAFLGTTELRAGDWPGQGPEYNKACEPVCTKCVPVPDVRKETHVAYRCKALDICLPHRPLWDLFRGHANTCSQRGGCDDCHPCPVEMPPQCECQPRRKMVLLKKIVRVDCPAFKCEPVCPPKCGTRGPCEPGVAPALPGTAASLPLPVTMYRSIR